MEQILLNGLSVEQLKEIIADTVRANSEQKQQTKKEISLTAKENKFISRKETAALLHISLPTLNDLTKEGKLKSYLIGARVLYKPDEVLESVLQRNFADCTKKIG
ncbi:MAG TPA: helix-turn-helix domain-containing protein [Bacteroidia bacterium]|jgi:excisionase family DNA binding protein|nr:helix-turn-helix domain-containing protein [Bacteroidia bacterium]